MLELKKIKKIYETEDLKQIALDEVSMNFRENEFTAILGPSGSGKTTLLNIIGGLDKYNDGDLVINEVSTKKYNARAWDSYRNHRVGFVFQSYNLINHQSILSNVELALTLSGVSKKERVKRAKEALAKVGLEKHIKKKPNQLSGGQMQRVAIARALINNPDILLADEPTGALDSETSKQIMDLLKDVAKEKLVIMVTHNSDLASEYASRIITLKDGKVTSDSNPYDGKENTRETRNILKKSKKTSMSLKTALSLSLNNLLTKKGRTILTAFAGSIGIIGIALILSLSSGVQEYIDKTEKQTLSSYPLMIEASSIDLTSVIKSAQDSDKTLKTTICKDNKICTTDDISNNPALVFSSAAVVNNLIDFKISLDNNYENINDYITDIQYTYNLNLQLYSPNTENGIIRVNPNSLDLLGNKETTSSGMIQMPYMSVDVFKELINNNSLLESQYDIVAGKMPTKYNEMVLVVNSQNQLPLSVIYSLDIENRENLLSTLDEMKIGKEIFLDSINYDYNFLIGKKYKLVLNTDYFTKEGNIWTDNSSNINYMKNIINSSEDVTIVGIIKISDDAVEATSGFVGYTHELTEYVINEINLQDITKEQKNNENINVFTGTKFDNLSNSYKMNLDTLGIRSVDNPSTINIYPKDFEAKEEIEEIINKYNEKQEDETNKIKYTDYVGVLMSGITTVVDVITYVLIAFVAISLVVSSIMIAIITYISVLERTKEIGILRAIGASKKDISRVFVAETIIEGFVAGVFGILITILLNIPINAIVYNLVEVKNITHLPYLAGIILILISVTLTVIAGLIPSKVASKKDPVEALRSE